MSVTTFLSLRRTNYTAQPIHSHDGYVWHDYHLLHVDGASYDDSNVHGYDVQLLDGHGFEHDYVHVRDVNDVLHLLQNTSLL